MKLEEWDRMIGPRLGVLESAVHWLKFDAGNIESAVRNLPARPAWSTEARENLNKAETGLMVALAVVRASQKVYDNLPPIIDMNMEQKNESVHNVPV